MIELGIIMQNFFRSLRSGQLRPFDKEIVEPLFLHQKQDSDIYSAFFLKISIFRRFPFYYNFLEARYVTSGISAILFG
jgi:hypothetical protein